LFFVAVAAALPAAALLFPLAGRADDATVVLSQGVDAVTLDPLARTITPSNNVYVQMFDTLARHDPNGKLIPWAARSWRRVSPTVWEYKLRDGIKFWNGDPLTSADVKFAIEKIMDPAYKSEQAPRMATVDHVDAPDPLTVRITTKKPTPLLPGFPWLTAIVDSKYWKEHGDAYEAEHPMGSGPYIMTSWHRDEELDLDANPAWWHGKLAIKHVVFKPIPESAARVAALRTGETDLITNVPVQYQLQLAAGRNTRLSSARSIRVLFVAFNTVKPGSGPQNNKLVRQALNYAIDVPELVKTVLGGRGYEVASPIPPGFTGYDPTIPFYKHDLAKAKDLLAKAGYPNGQGLTLLINAPTGRYNKDKEIAQAIAGQIAQTGVKTDVKIQEWTNYINQTGNRDLTPMYELGWGNDSFDADNTLSSLFASNARLSTYANPALDKLIDAARYELDPKKRDAIYHQALTIIHDDAPWLFLFQYEDLYGASKRLVWDARGDELFYVDQMSLKT
jgi:peptide/nickel transport system substrate-binding protein